MIERDECRICGSTNTKTNRAKTVFCLECHYCVSGGRYKGNPNPQRMIGHPLYSKLGYKIKPGHEDFALAHRGPPEKL